MIRNRECPAWDEGPRWMGGKEAGLTHTLAASAGRRPTLPSAFPRCRRPEVECTCTALRGCTHAGEPVHTSLLHGFPLTANAWPRSALAYCKQPHWPGHMWGGLVWRRMERLQKNKLAILKTVILRGLLSNLSFLSWCTMVNDVSYTTAHKIHTLVISKYSNCCNEKTCCIPYCPELPITALFKTRNNGQWS